MSDALKALAAARDRGFQLRVRYYLQNKAVAVAAENTPDPKELKFAQQLMHPGNDNASPNPPIETLVARFAEVFVTDDTVLTGLVGNSFDHESFTDGQFETHVSRVFSDYAKGLA